MKKLLFSATLLFLPLHAYAQEITVTAVCSELPTGTEEEIENADYKPGVDSQGKPVAPADIGETIKAIQYPIQVPIEIDTLKFLEMELPSTIKDVTDMDANVAYATLYEDGRLEYNGQDISNHISYKCVDSLPKSSEVEAVAPAAAPAAPSTATPAPATPAAPATPKIETKTEVKTETKTESPAENVKKQ